jgi:hypothetical protein
MKTFLATLKSEGFLKNVIWKSVFDKPWTWQNTVERFHLWDPQEDAALCENAFRRKNRTVGYEQCAFNILGQNVIMNDLFIKLEHTDSTKYILLWNINWNVIRVQSSIVRYLTIMSLVTFTLMHITKLSTKSKLQ